MIEQVQEESQTIKTDTPYDNVARPGLMVDLDALFDTRLATLEFIDPWLAINALKNGYLDRVSDDFEFCPIALFKQVYDKRDLNILENSMLTDVVLIVLDFLKTAIKQRTDVNLYINIYPYDIDPQASGELLLPFYKAIDGQANIHVVKLNYKELSIKECKEHFSYLIKYDYIDWLKYHSKELVKNPMREITLVAPRLYLGGTPTQQQLDELGNAKMEPYRAVELVMSSFINLEYYIPRLFSASLKDSFIERIIEALKKRQERNESTQGVIKTA